MLLTRAPKRQIKCQPFLGVPRSQSVSSNKLSLQQTRWITIRNSHTRSPLIPKPTRTTFKLPSTTSTYRFAFRSVAINNAGLRLYTTPTGPETVAADQKQNVSQTTEGATSTISEQKQPFPFALDLESRSVKIVGLATLIPIIAGAVCPFFVPIDYAGYVVYAQLAYSSTLLSLLGGVHWGLALAQYRTSESVETYKPPTKFEQGIRLAAGLLPQLTAFWALGAPPLYGFGALIVGMTATMIIDGVMILRGLYPSRAIGELSPAVEGGSMTVAFFVLWVVLYKLARPVCSKLFKAYGTLPNGKQIEWDTRMVSTIHAVIAVIVAAYVLFFDKEYRNPSKTPSNPLGEFSLASSTPGLLVAAITLSYCWKHVGDWAMVVHHSVGIVPFTIGMYYGELVFYAAMIIMTEVSTPFVNNRWFFAVSNQTKTKRYVFNGFMMWLTFLLCRILWLPNILYTLYTHYHEIVKAHRLVWIPVCFGVSVTMLLSSYWFALITRGLIKALKGGSGSTESTPKPKKSPKSKIAYSKLKAAKD